MPSPASHIPLVNSDTGMIDKSWYRFLQNVAKGQFDSLTIPFPVTDDPAFDLGPTAAIHITPPTTASSRNFVAGIWIETDGGTTDKGRGILIDNTGASDALYIQVDGAGGTGEAVLLTASAASATGIVVGTTLSTHQGVVVRQETSINPTANGVLLTLAAEGALTEMVRVGSAAIAGQIGIIFRLFGANAKPIVVNDAGGNSVTVIGNDGSAFFKGIMQFGSDATATNNGQTVNITNVGPGGGAVSIQSWRKTRDDAGNLRYQPLFG